MMNRRLRIFFSGIGGSGMSALATFMSGRGSEIVGSDRAFDRNPRHPVHQVLLSRGIKIVPQDGRGLDGSFDIAVFSTAVEGDQPEAVRARSLGLTVMTRPQFLAGIVSSLSTIAVAGTSGKSTTSGMLAFLMRELCLDPSFIGGGRVKDFRTEHNPGNAITGTSDHLVIEACESDGTIVDYHPVRTIILNLDLDHHSIGDTSGMFRMLMDNTKGLIIANGDDRNLREIVPGNAVTFSLDAPSDYRVDNIHLLPLGSAFSARGVPLRLNLPGRYNISNAAACIALLSELGIPVRDIAPALERFQGIERRFDIHRDDAEGLVIDDYAHNPHKIAALMEAVKPLRERICYIFQPHGFGPTRMMKNEYIAAFADNLRDGDHLVVLPIFYEGGTVVRDISGRDISDGVAARGKSAEAVTGREEMLGKVSGWDGYVVLGARDETLSDFARQIAQRVTPLRRG